MAGAVDLLLYGVAIFISPVAVYFKKGVGAQFWVNCCLYCLLGVPGMLHAFYIIHTNKSDKRTRRAPAPSVYSPQTQQRYSNLPSLPHPDRYRPPASYSPYEDHPPPVPPKREDTLPYDPSLHPNATGTNIGRAKAVLHTYQIPESTLHPPPASQRVRPPVSPPQPPRQELEPEAGTLLRPPPQPQPQSSSEPPPAPNSTHSEATLAYPAEYHPNAAGKNIANAKAVLHTYQIPETTFPSAPQSDPDPAPETQKRPEASATTSKGKSMWSLKGRGKGLSTLDVNSPTAVPSPSSHTPPRPKWHTGPSWLRRRKNHEQTPIITTTDEDEGNGTVTMVWDDKYERLRPPNKSLGRASGTGGAHTRSASDPMALPFPMPPGSVRPVVDRTGTSNTVLVRPGRGGRSESGLDAVREESPRPEEVMSEVEGVSNAKKLRRDDGKEHNTDTEAARPQHRLMNKLSRRVRPRLDVIGDTPAPGSAPSVAAPVSQTTSSAPSPPRVNTLDQNRSMSSPLSRHIAPPAVLASSIEEPRAGSGIFRRAHSNSQESPASPVSPGSPNRNNVDFRFAELGLGRAGDAYSAGSRALRSSSRDQERERRGSLGTVQGPVRSPKRLSTGTAGSPTSDRFTGAGSSTVPVMRRGLTQGTFGTGMGSASATSEDSPVAGKREPKTEAKDKEEEQGLSQDEQIDRWIQREDERRSPSKSQSPTSHGHPSPDEYHASGPDAASLFSEESSGFAGLGVMSAQEKGRSGRIEVWDRPNWDGSDPSASPEASSAQHHHAHYHSEDPFLDQAPSIQTHSSYATGRESVRAQPLSPPTSPRPNHPNRPPPAVPQTPVQNKPATLRMDTFGTGERPAFGLLSPPATERVKSKGKERVISPTPPVPPRPSASSLRPQSPKLPPKPAILRTMSGGEEDDLSVVYARALRDEL